ncbi:MAG: endonuclease Q family protein, partial [Candidatus Woesearchaeota archaeon]
MEIISDLHLHGKYSRACSKNLSIANLEKYGRIKGLNLLGTADFTHPEWIKELKTNLTEDETGFLKTKTGFNFLLTTEISLIYTDKGKGRRVHHVLFAPSFDVVSQITEELLKHGRIDYDGRPIFKIPSPDFTEKMKEISKDIEIIPAHIWTPWFGMLGSKSGFDSLKDCFDDQAKNIHAIETGLSSDPEMNWRIKELDNKAIVSFSDSHSYWPHRIGREATIFDIKPAYKSLIGSIRENNVKSTVEFWPDEGKYHYDGHRNCNVVMHPKESLKNNNICPVCKKPLTIGEAFCTQGIYCCFSRI